MTIFWKLARRQDIDIFSGLGPLIRLAALYRQAAGQLDGLTTMADWSMFMGRAIKNLGLDTQLRVVQRCIGDEFNAKFPRAPTAPVDKPLVAAQLTRMAALLEALK